ncbi:hypothetical protein BaRGS_00033894 [Batillaria attramentaria]|uniref:Uncharacterized protein n=1 Tax=Batillaria attramentaria TaxID=370345 RepID=A0ABD0JIP4_9CAEN
MAVGDVTIPFRSFIRSLTQCLSSSMNVSDVTASPDLVMEDALCRQPPPYRPYVGSTWCRGVSRLLSIKIDVWNRSACQQKKEIFS